MDATDADPDPATVEIIRDKLGSIAEEMQGLVMRSAYSPLWQEAGDLSAAVLSREAEVVGQSDRVIPVHVASMHNTVEACIEGTGGYDELREGDVLVQNDPYAGTLHLPNVTLAEPAFHDGTLVGFSSVQGHWVDIGGSSATGYDLASDVEIVEEGLRIPSSKLYRAGERNDALFGVIVANTRDAEERLGDLNAQLAGVRRGRDRLVELSEDYGAGAVRGAIATVLENDERRMRRRLGDLPDGEYGVEDYVEGGDAADGRVRIEATVTIDGDEARVDFAGSDDQVGGPINSSWSSTESCVHYGFKVTLDPGSPGTLGAYRPIEVTAPEGSIVNPTYPAPVVAQHSAGTRVYDLMVKAIAGIDPELAFGAGEGSSNVFSYRSLETGEFNYTCMVGGLGACPGRDGIDGIRSGRGNTGVQPVERVESEYGFVAVESFGLVPDSGGAGRHRGGCGAERTTRLADPSRIVVAADRTETRPFGVAGGEPGGSAEHVLAGPDGGERRLPPKTTREVPAGSRIRYRAAGAGGYGDPHERPPERVLEDVLDGYVSVEAAREVYGVAVDPETGTVDREATDRLRPE